MTGSLRATFAIGVGYAAKGLYTFRDCVDSAVYCQLLSNLDCSDAIDFYSNISIF